MDRYRVARALVPAAAAGVLLGMVAAAAAAPALRNGFVLEPASVPVSEILPGGPPRDGIPALNRPAHVAAGEAPWSDADRVIGLVSDGEARAYPIDILVWHELVNDVLGGSPVLVTYCPLCGTGMVFDRRLDGRERRFGVSGLLYRSDLLLYDRETESLWSQIASEAVTGPSRGQRLRLLRSRLLSWGEWKRTHPETTVLSLETGHSRRYGASPYGDYARSERLVFPAPLDRRYHPKTPTVGLRIRGGPARAYPADELLRAGGRVEERWSGHDVVVAYDGGAGVFRVDVPEAVEVVEGFWFAWAAFHPETSVFVSSQEPKDEER